MIPERSALSFLTPYIPGREMDGGIKLSSNENPLGASPRALEAIAASSAQVSLYPDSSARALRARLAERLQRVPDQLIIGNGSDEILHLLAAAFINPGDEAVISRHTFSVYESTARLFGATPIFVDLKNDVYDLDAMADAVTAKTKIIYLCNPNNPTGTIYAKSALDAFLKKIPAHILVVVDEAYYEYVTHLDYPQTLDCNNEHLIILRTFSKVYGLAGLRVGYGISAPNIIASLNKVKPPFSVNRLAQHAAMAALGDDTFLRTSKATNEAGKIFLYDAFEKLGLSYLPTSANFIFVCTPIPGKTVFEKLLTAGISIRPLDSFGYPDAIRVTVGTGEQNMAFVNELVKVL